RRWELRDALGAALLEIDDDEVSVLVSGAGGRGRRLAARFREVEVELRGGGLDVLDAVVARLRAAGAGQPDLTPKVVRALGPRAVEAPDVVVGPVGRDSSAADVVRAGLAASVARLFRHDPGVRLGGDAEDVHQARVATRRMRSDLRTFGPLLDDAWARELRDELGWIADMLGAVRDADVLLERLRGQSELLPKADAAAADALLVGLERQQVDATASLLAAMGSARYAELLDRLVAAANAPRFATAGAEPGRDEQAIAAEPVLVLSATATSASFTGTSGAGGVAVATDAPATEHPATQHPATGAAATDVPTSDGPASEAPATNPSAAEAPAGDSLGAATGEAPRALPNAQSRAEEAAVDVLPDLVRRPWRRLARAVGALGPAPEDDALHGARIEAKRCRYALEAAAPAIGKQAAKLASAVAELQTVLGDLHDAVVAEAWLRDAVADAPSAQALAAGELIAVQRGDAEACRRAWAPAWERASRTPARAWLTRGGRRPARGGDRSG
ncbi:MAG TPA: CHAD domain-containing protein, partial [Candidatus Dormibacteraeota bacterium]|nr:CHAD domain-containing protein [Candidatus Dormibacteraeota bacterium]